MVGGRGKSSAVKTGHPRIHDFLAGGSSSVDSRFLVRPELFCGASLSEEAAIQCRGLFFPKLFFQKIILEKMKFHL